jgi:hypothetical protein
MMTILFSMLSLLIGLILIYLFIIRPWQLRWGASQTEVELILPGDNLVLKPNFNATRAISINASPEIIWRWIIQIGSKRAGWYSIDWIDNGGVKSSNEILQQSQNIAIDQFIPFTPDQKNGMWVKDFKSYQYILWVDKIRNATWLWYLIPDDNNNTRLLTRLKTKYVWKGFWIFYYLLFDMGDIIMMRRCMKGIKRRAELKKLQLNKQL